jgi:hypothetical protein
MVKAKKNSAKESPGILRCIHRKGPVEDLVKYTGEKM